MEEDTWHTTVEADRSKAFSTIYVELEEQMQVVFFFFILGLFKIRGQIFQRGENCNALKFKENK